MDWFGSDRTVLVSLYFELLKPQDICVILPISERPQGRREKEKRPFAFCDAGGIYTWCIILIPHTSASS